MSPLSMRKPLCRADYNVSTRQAVMSSQILALFQQVREGDGKALDELMPQVYDELRRIAQSFMRRQRPEHTLQPTALINEAFIKLFEDARPVFVDRAHFLALMARVMRQVLVDHARAVGAVKRGGSERRVEWDTNIEVAAARGGRPLNVLELQDALNALGRESRFLAEVVEMHYFGGMTAEEMAVVVGRSVHTVRHDLRLARAWLRRELAG
jgi:RNA polymerase sigma factor (TIGR02999 family)